MWTYATNFYSTWKHLFTSKVTGLPHLNSLQWIQKFSERALFVPEAERERERQRQRQRALLLAHSKPERCGHRGREHLCSSLFHSCLMGGCRGMLPLPFGYHWKVWWAEASFLTASAQHHFLSVLRDVPGCASQQNSRVQISAFVWFPWHPNCFFYCLDVPTFS